jgi:hypothetical protein
LSLSECQLPFAVGGGERAGAGTGTGAGGGGIGTGAGGGGRAASCCSRAVRVDLSLYAANDGACLNSQSSNSRAVACSFSPEASGLGGAFSRRFTCARALVREVAV